MNVYQILASNSLWFLRYRHSVPGPFSPKIFSAAQIFAFMASG